MMQPRFCPSCARGDGGRDNRRSLAGADVQGGSGSFKGVERMIGENGDVSDPEFSEWELLMCSVGVRQLADWGRRHALR